MILKQPQRVTESFLYRLQFCLRDQVGEYFLQLRACMGIKELHWAAGAMTCAVWVPLLWLGGAAGLSSLSSKPAE
jgi:hypothetical protein